MIKTSSLFSHIFIPLAILFIFHKELKIDPKKIILLSFFGMLPDADIFYGHRSLLHNIFVIIIPLLIFIFLKNSREISGIICFYLASHVILDIFNGGTYLLYPLYDNVFFARTEIFFNSNDSSTTFIYGISKNIVSTIKTRESIISSENFVTMILLMMVALVTIIKNKKGR